MTVQEVASEISVAGINERDAIVRFEAYPNHYDQLRAVYWHQRGEWARKLWRVYNCANRPYGDDIGYFAPYARFLPQEVANDH